MSFTLENGTEIKSISSGDNTDYYQWGLNCKNLKFTPSQVDKILESYRDKMTDEETTAFFEGYCN